MQLTHLNLTLFAMKKILKILGIILGIVILFLLLAPLLFKGTLEDLLKKNINENLNAKVTWEELDLSLFSSFPDAAIVVKNFSVVNNAPFEGDTLASGARLKIDMGITQLFKSGDEPIKVDALQLDKALINIKVDSLGRANYDIAVKKDGAEATDTSEENNNGFTFDLTHYEINESRINYLDQSTQTFLVLTDVNHEGNGDFALDISELKTKTHIHSSKIARPAQSSLYRLRQPERPAQANLPFDEMTLCATISGWIEALRPDDPLGAEVPGSRSPVYMATDDTREKEHLPAWVMAGGGTSAYVYLNPDHWLVCWAMGTGAEDPRSLAWLLLAVYAEINALLRAVTNEDEQEFQRRLSAALREGRLLPIAPLPMTMPGG